MQTTYEQFLSEHHLPPTAASTEDLERLAQWCQQHISQDCRYTGAPEVQYDAYLALAKDYLDVFGQMDPRDPATLHYAASRGYDRAIGPEQATLLDIKNPLEMTALHLAAAAGHLHTVAALVDLGANVKLPNHQLQWPIHSALFLPAIHEPSLVENKEAVFRLLLSHTDNGISAGDKYGNSPVHLMARAGFNSLVIEQITVNPRLASLQNAELDTPLHLAILNRHIPSIAGLCAIDGITDIPNQHGATALHYAVLHGTPEILELCCQHARHLNARNHAGKTPSMLAKNDRTGQSMREILIKYSAQDHPATSTLRT